MDVEVYMVSEVSKARKTSKAAARNGIGGAFFFPGAGEHCLISWLVGGIA